MSNELDAALTRERTNMAERYTIRCNACSGDPVGRWTQPPAMVFRDRYLEDGSVRRDANNQVVFVHACRDHLSAKREEEIQAREGDRGWKKENCDEQQHNGQRASGKRCCWKGSRPDKARRTFATNTER